MISDFYSVTKTSVYKSFLLNWVPKQETGIDLQSSEFSFSSPWGGFEHTTRINLSPNGRKSPSSVGESPGLAWRGNCTRATLYRKCGSENQLGVSRLALSPPRLLEVHVHWLNTTTFLCSTVAAVAFGAVSLYESQQNRKSCQPTLHVLPTDLLSSQFSSFFCVFFSKRYSDIVVMVSLSSFWHMFGQRTMLHMWSLWWSH